MTPRDALEHLWMLAACSPAALDDLDVSGDDPGLPSIYRLGALAAGTIGAAALAAAELHRLRTDVRQRVEIDVRRSLAAFRSERYVQIDESVPFEMGDPVTGYYPTRDGRWIQLHANFAHHRDGIAQVLGTSTERADVAAAILERDGAELDETLAARGLCAALIRSPREWSAHAQAHAIASLPLIEIERIGDAPPQWPATSGDAARPLSGVRVLDLTRIIAGPVAGRTLAEHGADVLLVNGPHLPNIAPLVIDNGRGKRSATLDLRERAACEQLRSLAAHADVFLQSYRPGTLDARGFSAAELARLRPGIVHVSVSAYGHCGPWSGRRGFDSLVQSASGIVWSESVAAAGNSAAHGFERPRPLPCQALDHATGYLAAFGAMVALARRAVEGGSWQVRVSLAQTGRWLQTMGLVEDGARAADVGAADLADCLVVTDTPFGRVRSVAGAARMTATPPFFAQPPVPIGTHAAEW